MPQRVSRFISDSDIIFHEAFRRFAFIGAGVAWILSALWAAQQMYILAALLFAFGAVELLLYRFARQLGAVVAATAATALPTLWIIAIVMMTGGPTAPRGVWLLLPPLVAGLVFHARYARRWTLVYAAIVLGMWAAQILGYTFPSMLPDDPSGYSYVVTGMTAFLATVGLTLTYAGTQQMALDSVGNAHAHLNLVLASLPEGVLAVQHEPGPTGRHRVLYLNPVMSELLGGADTGAVLDDVVRGRDPGFGGEFLGHLATTGRSSGPVEHRIEHGDAGIRRTLEVHSRQLQVPGGGTQIVSIVRDLTDRLDTDRRLLQAARLASIGELVAGVAHELNNPLAAIMSTAELCVTEPGAATEEDLLRIRDNAARASRIVRSLLGFARATPPERTAVDVNEVVRQVLRLKPPAPRVTLRLDLEQSLPLTLADPAQLEQVVTNLLGNAELALRETGRADAVIDIRTSTNGERLRLEISDNGPGIAADILPRIFDPFYTTRQFGQGTGLGLALAHGIAASHGGSISAASSVGAGATFTVELPLIPPDAAHPADWRARAADAAGRRTRRTPTSRHVLVVDDEETIRSVVGRYLERRGHQVTPAATGEEAIRLAPQHDYDVVVLDIRMPGISGEDVFRQLRHSRPDLARRVIFATGDTVTASTSGFLHSTGQPVLEKPYDLARLASLIEERE
jgi:signal transduction histidine kinase/CheY-like chemotaxis protein